MIKKCGFVALGLLIFLSASAQDANFQDALLDKFAGNWVLEGEIAGGDATHDIIAGWVLGHQYFRFHDVSRKTVEGGIPLYDATVFIGWDEPSSRYVCLWLDSTGGGGLSNGILGYAEPSDDKLAFVFGMDNETFHTTFAYDREKDSWDWTMNAERDGERTPFARATMIKR